MAELKITAANFENEVLRSDKPVLPDFYADWCGPCKMLSPILHELAEEKSGALKVGKVNVDEQMELAMRFQVSSIPMLVVFKDGKTVAKSVGLPLATSLFRKDSRAFTSSRRSPAQSANTRFLLYLNTTTPQQ